MNVSPETNDDDAERAHNRRSRGRSSNLSTTSLSSEMLDEEHENANDCMQKFYDNKINKANAWQLTLIDNMANLCRYHHKSLRNFQIVGSTLEATTKIYGLRVDSVYSDIVRMSSGLGRMKAGPIHHGDDDDDYQHDENGATLNADGESNQPKASVKRKRTRKHMCTITKNKDTLNGRLDLTQTPDALFYKLNSIMGETSSSNKLILNILETRTSDLSVAMSRRFWDERDSQPIQFADDDIYDTHNITYLELPMKPYISAQCTLRQQMIGYSITNTPIDDVEEEDVARIADPQFNISQLDYAFDMAADIEPIPPADSFTIDYDSLDCDGGNDFDDLTQDDRDAIDACKGLRRKPTLINDMRPCDGARLEYSYRPLDNINQFWAGPSYWKIRPAARKLMGRLTISATESTSSNTTQAVKRRVSNRSKVRTVKFVNHVSRKPRDSGHNDDDDDDDEDDEIFLSIDSKTALKFKKTNVYKRWDSKRLKLPTDLHIDRDLFNSYLYCPSAVSRKDIIENATPANDGDTYDSDHNDIEMHDNDDIMMDEDVCDGIPLDLHASDVPEIDTNVEHSQPLQIPESQYTQAEGEISQTYEGAPRQIKQIEIQFARRAKVIDMKQMKSITLNTIRRQCEKTSNRTFTHPNARADEKYKDGAASFGVIYNTLPHLLSRMNAENLSPSIAFYTVLHLANEHRFRLYKSNKEDDMNVFLMRQLEE